MRYLFVLLLATSTFVLHAQQITGEAKDENGAPLTGAEDELKRAQESGSVLGGN